MKKVKNNNDFYLFGNTFSKMKYVSSIVFSKLFSKTTCENRLYYAVFGSSRLQKRLEYGENVKITFLSTFLHEKKTKILFSRLISLHEFVEFDVHVYSDFAHS